MNSDILKKIFALMMSFGVAQIILLLATPLLTRLYAPSTFAYFGYVVSFVTVILPLSSLQYEYAIPLLKIKQAVQLLTKLCIYLVICTSLAVFTIFLIIRSQYPTFNIHVDILVISFAILLLQGMLQVYAMPLIAGGNAAMVAHGKVIQNACMIVIQIFLALFFFRSSIALLIGLAVGLAANLIYYRALLLTKSLQARVTLTKRRLFFFLRRYYKLPLFSSWAMLIESASTLMPVLMIWPLYGAKSSGIYFLIYRVFNAPTGLLSTAMSKVMLKELGDRIKHQQCILPLFKTSSLFLASIALFYLMMMWFIAAYTPLIFGQDWLDTKPVLKVLAPIIAMTLCVSPLSAVFVLLNRNGVDSTWQLLYFVSTIAIIYLYRDSSFLAMLIHLTSLWIILYSLYWFLMFRIISRRDKQIGAALARFR